MNVDRGADLGPVVDELGRIVTENDTAVRSPLAEEPGVRTESRGEGDRRYVQVLPEDGDD